ncbi:hypothetical protein NDU88_001292 [Pleurodeles waltl]|uniref:Uncharacterized protein n=1 Tax=Pleurodeles waltl TaxID=8319 RepID=A0AAV7P519_PLEWA|nr:hypothetical protein NDU88_001292 [Pleurodeles waltl]
METRSEPQKYFCLKHADSRVLEPCSRLSVDPAHDAPEWRLPHGVRGENDGLPCSLGNGDAGTSLGNPDIRVPDRTKREDGLHLKKVEDAEKAEKTERKETEENTENEERKEDEDGRRYSRPAGNRKER